MNHESGNRGGLLVGQGPIHDPVEVADRDPAVDVYGTVGLRPHAGHCDVVLIGDVTHNDLSRYRTGHGAKNMTIVRHFALGLVRANKAKGSVKTRRKTAGWSPDFLLEILQLK